MLDVNFFNNEQDYVNAVRDAIDHQLNRPMSNTIDPGLVAYARQTHNYNAMHMFDRDRLNMVRLEISRIERNHARLRRAYRERLDNGVNVAQNDGLFSCPICFDEIRQQMALALVPCGHVFCTTCIDGYLIRIRRTQRPTCPLCRQFLRRGRTLRLYITYSEHE